MIKRIRYLCYISVLIIYCIIPSVSQGQPILNVNQNSFLKGDEAVFSIGNSSSVLSTDPVDVYIAFKLPGSDNLYYWPTFSNFPNPCITSWVPEPIPMTNFFSYTFSGTEPPGEYRLYAAFFKAGKFDESSLVGSIADITFQMEQSPPGGLVLKVVPVNGQSFSTISPIFSITFVSPIDLESIKWASKIQVESVTSGKVVTLYSEDGTNGGDPSLFVKLVTPDMTITHKISAGEETLVSLESDDNGKTLKMPVHPVTIEGETFSLHKGGQYKFSIEFLDGAKLSDGTSLAKTIIGPIEFFIK